MPGLTQGLEIARRALLAQQAVLNVTGNNLANVGTKGYTRQVAILRPSASERTPDGILGTGVNMMGVQRTRDIFLDTQLRQELGLAGRWQARSETLSRAEGVLNEPSDAGLGQVLDDFWNAWLDLSNQPEDSAARAVVLRRGEALAQGLRQLDTRIRDVIDATDTDLEQRVLQLNQRFRELGNLNAQIARAEVGGGIESNLRDQRDLILDELAREAGATHLVRGDGTAVVRLGGRTVVEGTSVVELETQRYNDDGRVRIRLAFTNEMNPPTFLSGRLAGLLEVRDQVLPSFLEQMDQMASGLVDSVNRLHAAGPSHLPFFRGDSAAEFEVAPEVANDLSQVNAGTTGDPGDNDIALAIAGLRDARMMTRGTATIGDYYRGRVAEIGSLTQQANFMSESQESAVQNLESSRQSAIGVNLDEELTRMITTQKAYQAAARAFTTISEMMDTLLKL